MSEGDYDALAGAGVVLITSEVNEKTGGATDRSDSQGRLRLFDKNAAIYRDIVPKIVRSAPEAVLVAITDPPDPLADIVRILAGHDRVLSAGTLLDSLRFRVHLGAYFGVDAADVEAQVIGDHGTSQVFLWYSASMSWSEEEGPLAHFVFNLVKSSRCQIYRAVSVQLISFRLVDGFFRNRAKLLFEIEF